MNAEKPLYWHQGLFLQPQHLQLNDLYQNSLLSTFYKYGKPNFWGLAGLQIHDAGLLSKSFEILGGEFVFQDGSHVVFPGNAVLRPRSFDDSWLEAEKTFPVYLGLRKWEVSRKNVTVVDSLDDAPEINTRYVTTADPDEVQDLHAGGPSGQVKRLNYVLRIFWATEKEQLDNYHLIPIAELERYGEEIRLTSKFVPPCLTVAASDWILKVIKDVRDQIISRCRQLEEYKSPKQAQDQEFDIGYIVFLLALRSLNRYVPLLQQIAETKNIHPWEVYGVMRQLIGELSTFSDNLSATGERPDGQRVLPVYDHDNLWPAFSAVQSLVGELLDGITVGPGHLLRLTFDGAYYSSDVAEQMLDSRNRFWLVLRTEADPEAVVSSVRRVAKLSARKNISTLIARAVPGIPLEYFPTPPPGLPRRPHSFYYRIDQTSPQWLDVAVSRAISLFWDTSPQDLVAEILILRS